MNLVAQEVNQNMWKVLLVIMRRREGRKIRNHFKENMLRRLKILFQIVKLPIFTPKVKKKKKTRGRDVQKLSYCFSINVK